MGIILGHEEISDTTKIKKSNMAIFDIIKTHCKYTFDTLWKKKDEHGQIVNKTKEEAQASLDEFGTSAVLAYQAHAKEQELIALVDSSWVPLVPPYSGTANEDGTVTLT